ncbi:MAG: hypothetical protein U1A72_00790 [Sulfuritalea sp.]|nr:hypothetical protein [Sulfuritalea sp.]
MSEVLDPLQFHQGGADLGAVVPVGSGMARSVSGMPVNEIITAQRVAVPRDMRRILANMKALATAAGKEYVYGWEVNDRKNNRKVWIEGPTITLANDLAREYMNCQVDCRVIDEGKHWVFYARFVDLETGSSMVRAYQQRKGQDTGMRDDQRALDMVFQIGQSKAIRNVVVNALRSLVNYAMDAAKGALLDKVGKNPEGARQWIKQELVRLAIDLKRVEAVYGRTAEHWTVPDMARIYTELQSVADGMMNAEDVYPAPDDPAKKREADNPLATGQEAGQPKTAAQQAITHGETSGAPLADPSNPPAAAAASTPPGELMDKADQQTGPVTPAADAPKRGPGRPKRAPIFGGDA